MIRSSLALAAFLLQVAYSDDVGCSVCGVGMAVTIPNAIFEFPGQPLVTCDQLQDAGATGLIPLDQCPFLPGFINELCGCDVAMTDPPVTGAPVVAP